MPNGVEAWSMIRKSMPSGHDPTGGNRFSLATNASVARRSCSNKRYSRSLIQTLAVDLKQAGAALATADAHCHDAPLCLAPTALLQDVARKPRAGHPKGVADSDRAAVDIVLVRIDAKLVAGIEALTGKSLVELPNINIVDFQTMALQQLGHSEDWTDAHLVRLAARHRPGDKAAERFKATFFCVFGFH